MMQVQDVIDRMPGIGQAQGEWTLHAHERGQVSPLTVRLQDYCQCRDLAIELSERGFIVRVCDPADCQRLQLWPPRLHA